MDSSKEICVLTNGCPESRIDCARVQEFLRQNGWVVTSEFRDADIIVFHSCGLTQFAQEYSVYIINQIKDQKKPTAQLIVCGCLPKINKDRLSEIHEGITFGADEELEILSEMFGTRMKVQDVQANFLIPCTSIRYPNPKRSIGSLLWHIASPTAILYKLLEFVYRDREAEIERAINVYGPDIFCIKVCTGCLSACSFCAVRHSRGRVRSKSIDQVVKEFQEGLEKGYRKFGLIGTDLGSFGRDRGTNLVALLNELLKTKGDYKIRLRNIQPRFLVEMMPELQEVLRTGKIAYLSSAAQSGNNRILILMNRGYSIEDFKGAIGVLNKEFPEIQIRTQLMVGFPSETEEEFQDTVRLLDELTLDFVEIYTFESRPLTKAAKMGGKIPPKVARKRYYRLYIKAAFNQRKRRKRALKEYRAGLN